MELDATVSKILYCEWENANDSLRYEKRDKTWSKHLVKVLAKTEFSGRKETAVSKLKKVFYHKLIQLN